MSFRESARAETFTGEWPANGIPEEWKEIEGYPDYEVSDQGRVRSLKWGKTKVLKGYLNSTLPGRGYLQVKLIGEGVRHHRLVNRLVALAFLPNPEAKATVAHNDGSRLNNRVGNLRWATPPENQADRGPHGTAGAPRPRVVTHEQALAILRDNYATYDSVLAKRYGCTKENICHIRRGRTHRKAFEQYHAEKNVANAPLENQL